LVYRREGERTLTHIPVAHSLFETQALATIVGERYDIGTISSFDLYRSYVNDVYRVDTSSGATYFLKVARRAWRTLDDIGWDVALQQHLRRHRVSVSEPIPQRDGDPVCVLDAPEGSRGAVLYAETAGIKPQPPITPELYEVVGRGTARMHKVLDHFDAPTPRPGRTVQWLIDRSGAIVAASLDAGDKNRRFVEHFSQRLGADVEARVPALDWGVCHGDMTLDNITIDRDGTVWFFDFDLAAPAWRASEPSGIYTWAVEEPSVLPLWNAYLVGYRMERPFGEHEEAAVPSFAAAYDLWDLAHELEHWRHWSGRWRTTPRIVRERIDRLRTWAERLGFPPP
jgi:Ser/Thr protein kinase RdoA (MazF antagonist)